MSEFITGNIETTITEEEAVQILHESLFTVSDEAVDLHDELVDATQLLALGGFTLDTVAGAAVKQAKEENDYGVGRTFDIFTADGLRYGRHLAAVVSRITKSDTVTRVMAYAGKYMKSRTQIQINSELKTDQQGKRYFEYLRRQHMVTSNLYTPWNLFDKKNGVRRTLKLYADLQNQKFYTVRNGQRVSVALGSPVVFDTVINAVHASGIVESYVMALNSIPQETVELLSEDQQLLFLNVFKALK